MHHVAVAQEASFVDAMPDYLWLISSTRAELVLRQIALTSRTRELQLAAYKMSRVGLQKATPHHSQVYSVLPTTTTHLGPA